MVLTEGLLVVSFLVFGLAFGGALSCSAATAAGSHWWWTLKFDYYE